MWHFCRIRHFAGVCRPHNWDFRWIKNHSHTRHISQRRQPARTYDSCTFQWRDHDRVRCGGSLNLIESNRMWYSLCSRRTAHNWPLCVFNSPTKSVVVLYPTWSSTVVIANYVAMFCHFHLDHMCLYPVAVCSHSNSNNRIAECDLFQCAKRVVQTRARFRLAFSQAQRLR